MSLIVTGKVIALLFFIVFIALIYMTLSRSKGGKVPTLNNIPGLDVLEEAVGRATELGRPVHFTTGVGKFEGATVSSLLAAYDVLGHVADLCAKLGAKLLVTQNQPSAIPLINSIVLEAYKANNAEDDFSPDSIQFRPKNAYVFEVLNILEKNKVASNIYMGPTAFETILICEQGYHVGAMQITGSTSLTQLPFMIATSDYVLIGEEMLVAGAYLSKDAVKIGSIVGQDYSKMIILALLALTAIMAAFGISIDFLSM